MTIVRRKLAFLFGLAFGLALLGLLRRRSAPVAPAAATVADERADELRRTLAQAREQGEAPGRPEPARAGDIESELEQARGDVYGDARATLDDMRRAGL